MCLSLKALAYMYVCLYMWCAYVCYACVLKEVVLSTQIEWTLNYESECRWNKGQCMISDEFLHLPISKNMFDK